MVNFIYSNITMFNRARIPMIRSYISVAFIVVMMSYGQEVVLRPENISAMNVSIEETVYRSRNALRVKETGQPGERLAILNAIRFGNGTIEAEVAGAMLPSAGAAARGFIGIAFRVSLTDSIRYDCFYLRPTNGRAEDQVRRNHATQYIAHPFYTWNWLREKYPSAYESYADLVEGEWTKIRIVVKGNQARLYIHDAGQPALIVNDLLNTVSSGGIALWVGPGTDGYFRNVKISHD